MKRLQRQRGIVNIQIAIAVAVVAIAQLGLFYYSLHKLSETNGKLLGGMTNDIRNAVEDYAKAYGPKIAAGQPVTYGATTVATALSPSLNELAALGLLHAAVDPVPPNGGSWHIVIEPSPATCVIPGPCNLTASVWPDKPLTTPNDSTKIDSVALDAAVAEINGNGGYSDTTSPGTIISPAGWNRPNKNGNVAGTLMAIGGTGAISYTALKNVGDACTIPGATATSTLGQELICRGTSYVTVLNSLPSYRVGQKILVKDGDVVTKPVCETGGTPSYSFENNQTAVDVATVPPLQSQYSTVQDNGATWKIIIHLKDRNTIDTSANPYNITAIFQTQCFYP